MLATDRRRAAQADPHAGHQQEKPASRRTEPKPACGQAHAELPPFIPPLTDEDRKAAFPDVDGHAVHDNAVNYFVLFDQLEWQAGKGANGLNLDSRGWVGRDRDRLWFRAEGDGDDGRVGEAQAHVLYGRQFSRWWDVVAGIRQDFRPGPAADVGGVWRAGAGAVLVRDRSNGLRRRLGPDARALRGRVRAAPHESAGPAAARRGGDLLGSRIPSEASAPA